MRVGVQRLAETQKRLEFDVLGAVVLPLTDSALRDAAELAELRLCQAAGYP